MSALFALLLIVSLGFLIKSAIKPIKNRKTGKSYSRRDTVLGFGILVILFAVLTTVTAPKTKPTATTDTVSAAKTTIKTDVDTKTNTPVAKPAATTPTPTASKAPTVPIATLNSQSVTTLTPVLSDFEQQMSQGQSYAAESNAGDVSSDFHTWEQNEQDKQNVTNNNEQVAAYNKADNAYYYANQTAPDALNNWDTDAGALPGDITEWANAEEVVADDQAFNGSVPSSDQQTATTALQQYDSDLAKAKTDLSQL